MNKKAVTDSWSREGEGQGDFAMLLKHYRKLRNFTLKDLEDASGVSQSYIHRLESGKRTSPTLEKLLQLSKALRIPDSVLISTIIKTSAEDANEERKATMLSDVLIQNQYYVGERVINLEAKQLLIQLVEYIADAEWSSRSKVREMYELSELIDQLKEAIK
ncbi:helix-turn-helix domain-containing protein [Brevibacillus borstelensis]|uniref:helix-turn-helix domain-containing protein n=1 Tax=Brevibacillus borstelensis TaxID=45462 RepID=UPI00149061C9|nr:helix-turn-helix transcriptional regulator [Brevibacillus borstelensis]NOU53740.1 helix-turn-helix domain-containing protein [Brevibacillus borstelensis]